MPLVESFEAWLRAERRKLSSKGPLAKAVDYQFNHWAAFTRFLRDGRICLSNNAAERAIRPAVRARKVSGGTRSPRGSKTSSVLRTLFETWALHGRNSLDACREMIVQSNRNSLLAAD